MPKLKLRGTVYEDASGQFRWRIMSVRGGKIVADSGESYTRKRDAMRAIGRLVSAILASEITIPAALRTKRYTVDFPAVRVMRVPAKRKGKRRAAV